MCMGLISKRMCVEQGLPLVLESPPVWCRLFLTYFPFHILLLPFHILSFSFFLLSLPSPGPGPAGGGG